MKKIELNEKNRLLQQVMDDKDITSTSLAVYVVIWKYYNTKYGYAYPTRRQICEKAHISIQTLDRALKILTDTGHIKIKSGKKTGKNTLYYLIDKPTETVETVEEWEVPNYYYNESEE